MSYGRPSRTLSAAITGGNRMLIASATNIPVFGPVSVAMISSRSPLGPVMMIVRRSITVGSALQDGALARRYRGCPMNPQTVLRKKPGSIYPMISSVTSPVEPVKTVVTSSTDNNPLEPALIRSVLVLLLPFIAFVGAAMRSKNIILPPGGRAIVVAVVSVMSAASSTPTTDCPPEVGLSINACPIHPCARFVR